MTEILNI